MNGCVSPCSDFLVIAASAGSLAALLFGHFYVSDKKCRCPVKAKCSHTNKKVKK